MQVFQVENDFLNSNTYILLGEDNQSSWLVDVGDVNKVIDKLPQGCNIKGVFLTHTHFDHIYGLNSLLELYPDITIYTNAVGKEALYSDRLNFSLYHDASFEYKGRKVELLGERDTIMLDNKATIEVIPTPGHSLDSYCYLLDNYLFTGDAYIPGIKVVTKLRGGNKQQAAESIKIIKSLITEKKVLCPGHGPIVYTS